MLCQGLFKKTVRAILYDGTNGSEVCAYIGWNYFVPNPAGVTREWMEFKKFIGPERWDYIRIYPDDVVYLDKEDVLHVERGYIFFAEWEPEDEETLEPS